MVQKCFIQFATSFAEEAFHVPLFPQPTKGFYKVELVRPKAFHFISNTTELLHLPFGGTVRSENNDGRKMLTENFGLWVQTSRSAHDYAKIVFRQALFKAHLPKPC